ncbi:ABC transporter ATP-binding protein [Streptosporangium sp. NPDC002524]|uniref:ABC transporter ATP-binding protein n=1 Tax=Streptosporangium sp. NPDC002524 TaxID=3154537 RepID=UPI00332E2BB7
MASAAAENDPVAVTGLSKRYGEHTVLTDLSLRVHPGEVFALLGPNGAGKTTTVEILTGVRRRSGGDVQVLGQDPARDPREWRARIGVVSQSTGAYPDLTVGEVVRQFAAMYPRPLPPTQVLDMVGLGPYEKKRTTELSGGQQRRLDVAVGVVGDPELIFLDEPTTGLDPVARREAWELVRFFSGRGRTTVLTTHYLDEAETLATRVGVIAGGRLVACGPPGELGGRETTPATVSFRRSESLAGRDLPDLPRGAVLEPGPAGAGDPVTVLTSEPTQLVSLLGAWAGTELPDLTVHRLTLEEIYLNLIDRHREQPEGNR